MKKPAYPVLAQLMSKHGFNRKDISKIIGLSYRQTLKKINQEKTGEDTVSLFDIQEGKKLVTFFNSLGENITMDDFFFGT